MQAYGCETYKGIWWPVYNWAGHDFSTSIVIFEPSVYTFLFFPPHTKQRGYVPWLDFFFWGGGGMPLKEKLEHHLCQVSSWWQTQHKHPTISHLHNIGGIIVVCPPPRPPPLHSLSVFKMLLARLTVSRACISTSGVLWRVFEQANKSSEVSALYSKHLILRASLGNRQAREKETSYQKKKIQINK